MAAYKISIWLYEDIVLIAFLNLPGIMTVKFSYF